MSTYSDGNKSTPVKVFDDSQAFDVCRERDRPTWVVVEESGEIYKAFPSGHFESAVKKVWPMERK